MSSILEYMNRGIFYLIFNRLNWNKKSIIFFSGKCSSVEYDNPQCISTVQN